jgi:hypothetical protein
MNSSRESTGDGDGLETLLYAWDGLDLTPLVTTNRAKGASLTILLLTHSAGSDRRVHAVVARCCAIANPATTDTGPPRSWNMLSMT